MPYDTVVEAVATARRLDYAGAENRLEAGPTYLVRVPGKQVGTCKAAAADIEPTILVETVVGGEVVDRLLCHEVLFHGEVWMGQRVGDPHPLNGAILWLETNEALTCLGPRGEAWEGVA